MNNRLAVCGSESLIKKVGQYVKDFEGIEYIPYIYDTIEESPELLRRATDVDVLFFTGSLWKMGHSEAAMAHYLNSRNSK